MGTAMLAARTVAVLLLVVGAAWMVRRAGRVKTARRAEVLEVVATQRLGRGVAVTVVRIGERSYALGVTERGVSLLTEAQLSPTPATDEQPAEEPAAHPGFVSALAEQLRLVSTGRAPRVVGRDAVTAAVQRSGFPV